MRVLIAGCGYVGLALGDRLRREGHEVFGIRRTREAAPSLRAAGIEPLTADLASPEQLARLPREWDAVVFCAAPSVGGEAAYRSVYLDGARCLLDWLESDPPRAFLFTGSTSVYGQLDGSVVTEESPTEDRGGTVGVLLATERLLLEAAGRGFPALLLRVAGIYGPRRNRIASFLRGEVRLTGQGERLMNWVHRDDLVGAITAALASGRTNQIYNVSDGAPAREREFYGWLAAELGAALPPATDGADATQRRRALSDRQINSDKLRRDAGWRPVFPTFREGYAPLIADWRRQGGA